MNARSPKLGTAAMFALGLALALPATTALTARDAHACGGCFSPPVAVQTVNAHRMVLSLARTRTILWDQFSYTGRPSDFSWILPIRSGPTTRVNVADDRFMTLLENVTVPLVSPPSRPFCGSSCFMGGFADSSAPSADASADSGTVVYRQEVVGPYEVAVIGGSDPMAIRNWLRDNGFAVPTAVSPVIDHYTGMRSDYIALRLRPGEGINRMVPIRVTMEGYVPVLPLRMIAAGVADKVGLSLTIFADSRIEAMNFPNGEISESNLTYDFNSPTNPATDFLNAFNAINRTNGGRVWLAESVTSQSSALLVSAADDYVRYVMPTAEDCLDGSGGRFDAGFEPDVEDGSDASEGGDGGEGSDGGGDAGVMCRAENAADDMRAAFEAIGTTATVTRLRADLAGAMLDRDLTLQASTRGLRARQYTYGNVLNTPVCPPPPDCGVGPGFDAGRSDGGSDAGPPPDVMAGRGMCSVRAPGVGAPGLAGLAGLCAAMAGFALRRGRRGKR